MISACKAPRWCASYVPPVSQDVFRPHLKKRRKPKPYTQLMSPFTGSLSLPPSQQRTVNELMAKKRAAASKGGKGSAPPAGSKRRRLYEAAEFVDSDDDDEGECEDVTGTVRRRSTV